MLNTILVVGFMFPEFDPQFNDALKKKDARIASSPSEKNMHGYRSL